MFAAFAMGGGGSSFAAIAADDAAPLALDGLGPELRVKASVSPTAICQAACANPVAKSEAPMPRKNTTIIL